MIFCSNCFKDSEASAMIRNELGKIIGKCPICGKNDASLYDTEKQKKLVPYFENLISIYAIDRFLPEEYPLSEKHTLIEDLNERWDFFSEISEASKLSIVRSICKDQLSETPELFEGLVGIPELFDETYLNAHSLLKNRNWEAFVDEITTKNRYHSKLVNFEVLKMYCSLIRKPYKAGDLFYRARISGSNGFSTYEMSAPPKGKSAEGRANAGGITCLYLANSIDTALHEVRAGAYDYVSVGKFQLQQDITIVNLKIINAISPLSEQIDLVDYAINKQYLENLNYEMSRPIRRSDSTLDYVPTQYIVDFIKSIENENEGQQVYDGIEYKSTMNPEGFNLAIFNPDLFKCVSVDLYEIEDLAYKKKQM